MTDEELDRIALALAPEPTPAERDAAWRDIRRRLEPPRPSRRRWLAVPAVAAAAALGVALLPSGEGGGPAPGLLASASAAEILRAAADGVLLDAPGPGEQLYTRERRVIPLGGGQTETIVTRSWSAADGSGRAEQTSGGVTRTQRFPAGESGRGDPYENWRVAFTADELRELPTERGPLLARLRAVADAGDEDAGVIGRDLVTLAVAIGLLDHAPLDAERRSALFELLAAAPEWTVPGTSATPMSVERVGAPTPAGYRLRVESRLTDAERRQISSDERNWALELTVDPEQGRLTEIREYEDGLQAPAQLTRIEEQRIVPAN